MFFPQLTMRTHGVVVETPVRSQSVGLTLRSAAGPHNSAAGERSEPAALLSSAPSAAAIVSERERGTHGIDRSLCSTLPNTQANIGASKNDRGARDARNGHPSP